MKVVTGPSIALLDERYVLDDDRWLVPPADDWYDPTDGLPEDPDVGDRYISEETAHGWTQDYVYEWDGDEWVESVPDEGWMIWLLFELIFYVFFSGGWMEVGDFTYLRLDASNDPVTGALLIENTLTVDGVADAVQATIRAHVTQTANIWENQLSDETVVSGADERGILFSDGGIDGGSVYIGSGAGNTGHTNAARNIGIGVNVLDAATTGDDNVAVGFLAGTALEDGDSNTLLGVNTGKALVGGAHNTFIGHDSGDSNTSSQNTAVGSFSLSGSGAGSENVAVGYAALISLTNGVKNTSLGRDAGGDLTIGDSNIFLGYSSGSKHTSSNTFIVDNQARADVATELTNSILYGVMAATPAGQSLRVNANLYIGGSNRELRFYEGENYVGLEAPALSGNQIWVLPDADGNDGDVMFTDGSGNLKWGANASTRAFTFSSPSGGSGTIYAGGHYRFGTSDNDFNPSITFGTADGAYGDHIFIVAAAGGSGGTDTVIRITGTSIDDSGNRTTSDTEDLTADDAGPAGAYYETTKKWVGQVTIEKQSGPDLLCNYGGAKYWDDNNEDFKVEGVEVTWLGGANDANPNLLLRHHKATGWTYNNGSAPTPPTAIADMNTDYSTEIEVINGEEGAWKRTNLSTNVSGSSSEGIILEIITTANKTFEIGNFLIRVVPQ